jgi:iron complex transport system permease protein
MVFWFRTLPVRPPWTRMPVELSRLLKAIVPMLRTALFEFSVTAAPAVVVCARWLPLTQLGPGTAVSLGVQPGVVRTTAVLAAVLLTATSTAFVGPISFIALCAPAIARPLLGHGALGIGTSAAVGAALLTTADLVAQYALPGVSLPVGVVTGALGAIFLLWLLSASKGRQL